MALATDLEIHKTGTELLDLCAELQANIPRSFRANMGSRIADECVQILVLIGRANAARQLSVRAEHLADLQGIVAATLVDMGHGESSRTGAKRWSHGVRDLRIPLGTCTASNPPSALVSAFLEQANGGFYDGDGRGADAPSSTVTASGSQQRLVTAYAVKYYSSGGQWQALHDPMHTLPTKARIGLVQVVQAPADCIAPEHRERARLVAELLHTHLPEHFATPADLVLMQHAGQWWAVVDITLRMLKPRELYRAQGFPEGYVIDQIPDPAHLFKDGQQAGDPLEIPRIPLSLTAQVRMCGNSVCPPVAQALVRANFAHEALIYGREAA